MPTISTAQLAEGMAGLLGLDTTAEGSLLNLLLMWDPVTPTDLAEMVTDFVNNAGVRDANYNDWWTGTATGGPEGDGRYPIHLFGGGSILLPSPASMLNDMSGGAVAAVVQAAADAETAASAAAASAAAALASENASETNAAEAASSASAADVSADIADTKADEAAASAAAVAGSASVADTKADEAAASAAAANASANIADAKADEVVASAVAAAASETASEASAEVASSAKDDAQAAATAAAASEAVAAAAAVTATDKAGDAQTAAADAENSKDDAAASATAAQTSASDAGTAADAAESFATASSASATASELSRLAAEAAADAAQDIADFDPANYATLASPTFTGTPAAPTPAFDDDSTRIATTAMVQAAVAGGGGEKAPLASPALTGTPTAPTPATSTNTTQIATTAMVQARIAELIGSAPSSFDTLQEIAAELAADDTAAAALVTTVAGKQPLHANLTALAGLSLVADKIPYANGTGTLALGDYTAFARTLDGLADYAALKSGLSLNNVQNKSSSTIRSELTFTDVTTALTYTPMVNSSGAITTALGYVPTSIVGATGAVSLSALKGYLQVDNVENKSSSTIRGEITSSNVNSALGLTVGSMAARAVTISSSSASGGSNGDFWAKV